MTDNIKKLADSIKKKEVEMLFSCVGKLILTDKLRAVNKWLRNYYQRQNTDFWDNGFAVFTLVFQWLLGDVKCFKGKNLKVSK